jgi:large subunit ribosomal protein L2
LICLISYFTGVISFIIAVEGLKIGDIIYTGLYASSLQAGNSTLVRNIGFNIYLNNLEINLYNGSKFLRASGAFGKIIRKNLNFSVIKLKSGKLKRVNNDCLATIGIILNFNFYLFRYKKAGLSRLKNKRPSVRGVAMNPVDHPYGGGEGKKSKKSICMSP